MELFIGNLPERATTADLAAFFKAFRKKAICRIEERRFTDGSRVRYGRVVFDSDRQAAKAIAKLNGKPLNGTPVVIREFFHRSYNNERRQLGWRDRPWAGEERRSGERRRQGQATPETDPLFTAAEEPAKPEAAPVFTAYREMARKY